jgi:DNA-nicking Smr family endonuclease
MAQDSLSKEDKRLFHEAMKGVTPLKSKDTQIQKAKKEDKPQLHSLHRNKHYKENIPTEPFEPKLSDNYLNTIRKDTILSYRQPCLSYKLFNRLKRGQIPIEDTLDLHGMSVDAARLTLCQFIKKQITNRSKTVLIIHGKAPKSPIPLLKCHLECWLRQIPQILGFHSAPNNQGGTGALVVMLKSK